MKTYSLVTPNRNRQEHLKQVLPSWQRSQQISEIVIVDFGSDEPIGVQQFQSPDKIKIVRVDNSDRWRIGLAINIGVVFSTSDRICKFDSDIALVDDGALAGLDTSDKFYRGDWRGSVSNGQVIFEKAAWKQVGGYNEWLSGYGFDDSDFYIRLRKAGLAENFIENGVLSEIKHSNELRGAGVNFSDEFLSIQLAGNDATFFQLQKNTCLAYLKRWRAEHRTQYSIVHSSTDRAVVRLLPFPEDSRILNAFAGFLGFCFIGGTPE